MGEAKTILIADDSAILRNQLGGLLKRSGFHVLEAEDGAQGAQIFAANSRQIGLVIADINMPKLDGISMVREIRKHENGAEAIVFVLTTETGADMKSEAKDLGVRAWVSKPFDEDKLVQAIEKVMGQAA